MDKVNYLIKENVRLREVLQKIADIEHEDIPVPTTPNEANVWTVLAMTIGLAEKALKEKESWTSLNVCGRQNYF